MSYHHILSIATPTCGSFAINITTTTPWNTTWDILISLLYHTDLHATLFERTSPYRVTGKQDLFIYHPYLTLPIILCHDWTDENFLWYLNAHYNYLRGY